MPSSTPGRRRAPGATKPRKAKAEWETTAARYIAPTNAPAPTDAEVLGALMRAGEKSDVVVCASGGLPGELHKLWRAGAPLGYHLEYGYSCMGYEIAGGIGVKMALPDREVLVVLGDGSYLMMNSEIATSVMLGQKLIIVVNDNRGFGCINRLQQATGGAPFNNLLRDVRHEAMPEVDFVAPRARAWRGSGEGQVDRRPRDGVQGGARGEIDPGDRHRHRSDGIDRRRRLLVGRRRAGGLRAKASRRRAPRLTRRPRRCSGLETKP